MKKTIAALIFICLVLTAFAGCETAKENVSEEASEVSWAVSEEVSETVSEEMSEEVSDEIYAEVSDEISEEVSKEDEVLTSVVGSWTEVYTEEDYADGYLWTCGFVFGENGCCVVYDTEYNVYEDENGETVFEGCGGNSRAGIYTLKGDTVTVMFDMSVQYGEGYTQTYKVSKNGENLIIDGIEYFLEAETGYVPEKLTEDMLYGLWEFYEFENGTCTKEWIEFKENGTCEYVKDSYVEANPGETDLILIDGKLYKREKRHEWIMGYFYIHGAETVALTIQSEDVIFTGYYLSLYEDFLTIFWQYDEENDIRSELVKVN